MKNKPNILFLFPDQLRFDWTGANEILPLRTPHLDALNRRGTRFTRAVTPSPLCAPCRACLASGRDYPRSPVRNNHDNLPLGPPTLYSRLRDEGYYVMACGKFDLNKGSCTTTADGWGLDGRRHLEAWGFSNGINSEGKMDGVRSGHYGVRGPYLKFLEQRGLRQQHLEDFAQRDGFASFTTPLPDDAYCDNWIGSNGMALLNKVPEAIPWFLQINFAGPHSPWDITENMASLYAETNFPQAAGCDQTTAAPFNSVRRNYAAMIENIDTWLGRYVSVLQQRGEIDRTLIVFGSDHGEMLGDHGHWGKSLPYQPSIGIPLTFAGPNVKPNATVEAPTTLLDLSATFLETAGAKPLPDMDSRTLWPVLNGGRSNRDVVFAGLEMWRVAWDGRYKLVEWPSDARTELYDLDNDPTEERDILDTGSHTGTRARLQAAIADYTSTA